MKLYSITRTNEEGLTQYYNFGDRGPQWTDEIREDSFTLSFETADFWVRDPWAIAGSKYIKIHTYTVTED